MLLNWATNNEDSLFIITQISPDYFKSILPKVANSNIPIFVIVGFPKALLHDRVHFHIVKHDVKSFENRDFIYTLPVYTIFLSQIPISSKYLFWFLIGKNFYQDQSQKLKEKTAAKDNPNRILQINSKDSTLERIKVMILKSGMILWLMRLFTINNVFHYLPHQAKKSGGAKSGECASHSVRQQHLIHSVVK